MSMNPNYQKTHYFLDSTRHKRKKVSANRNSTYEFGPMDTKAHGTVFRALSQETDEDVKHRFQLYLKVWSHQKKTIETILGSANNLLFEDLLNYIHEPLSQKLDCAFLSMSSNTANNIRILDEFSSQVNKNNVDSNSLVRVVRLNSKICFNGKAAIKEVVNQIVNEPKDCSTVVQSENVDSFGADQDEYDQDDEESELDKTKKELDDELEDFDLDDADDVDEFGEGRITYDFAIVEDWISTFFRKHNSEKDLRIIIVFDDADSFKNDVKNLLLQLLTKFALKSPIKVVMGLITKNVSRWINENITSKLRNLIQGVKLEAKDNKDIGYKVINEILLQNVITEQNPLLVSAQLSLIILNRFETSNNSIDSLITELKLSFMTYFYQLHLSAMLDPQFEPQNFHYDALRKLPSFKTHVEYFLQQYIETETQEHQLYICDLLENDEKIHSLFKEARLKFQKYQNTVMNAVNILHWLCGNKKEKFEIYKLITNNQLVNSPFLTDLLKSIRLFDSQKCADFNEFIRGNCIFPDLDQCSDPDVKLLKDSLSGLLDSILEHVTRYLHENQSLNMKINDNLFNEVLTITGGSSEIEDQMPKFSIEENFENLMINLIRPKLREVIEVALEEPQIYLRNTLVVQSDKQINDGQRLLGPSLSRLYQIYKDAPVNINLYDFYTAFKQSLLKRDIILEIEENYNECKSSMNPVLSEFIVQMKSSEEVWEKMIFAWFIQSCFELNSMGFIREKSKGDYMEKMVWRNL